MGKKIAIIGTTASMMDAPYKDESWEIWGLNGAYTCIPRYDRWFDMHDMEVLKKDHMPQYFDFLAQCGDKLMLNKKVEEYPNAHVFPYEDILEYFGVRYFTNTVAWLTAYAIMQDPEEIGIWGVNMAQDTEYHHQRPCCEFFLGIAKGMGIKTTIPEGSELLKGNRLYGIEPINPIMRKIPDKERELRINHDDVMREIKEIENEVAKINGLMDGINLTADVAIQNTKSGDLKKKLQDFSVQKSQQTKEAAIGLNNKLNMLYDKKAYYQGALDYNQYFKVNWGG